MVGPACAGGTGPAPAPGAPRPTPLIPPNLGLSRSTGPTATSPSLAPAHLILAMTARTPCPLKSSWKACRPWSTPARRARWRGVAGWACEGRRRARDRPNLTPTLTTTPHPGPTPPRTSTPCQVRYVGVSNETSYGVCQFIRLAEAGLGPRIVSTQNSYSLLVRSAYETDLAETCRATNVGLLAYSPLAGGVLSGKYLSGTPKNARLTLFEGYMARYNKSLAREAGGTGVCRGNRQRLPADGVHGRHPHPPATHQTTPGQSSPPLPSLPCLRRWANTSRWRRSTA